jgi:hypothetical protein
MATFGQMTDEVSRKLAGFTLRQDRQTHVITTALTSTVTSIKVASAQNISAGVIQIDDELIYIDSFDRTTGVLNVPPYGRGYNGTSPATHAIGAKVIISPTFPSLDIKGAINETIQAVYPDLYATSFHTFTYSPVKTTYALPDEVETVLGLAYQAIGPSKEWVPIRGWRQDTMANIDAFNSRNSISLYSGVQAGRTVQAFYTAVPTVMDTDTDDFETVGKFIKSLTYKWADSEKKLESYDQLFKIKFYSRFFQYWDQRPYPIHVGDRSWERSHRAPLRAHAPCGAEDIKAHCG